MGMEYSLGLMGENNKVITKMIKKMDMVYSNGLMVENIKVIGQMGNKMDKENFLMLKQKLGENA